MIAVRAPASREYGLGHLFRAMRLGDALRERGHDVIILTEENAVSAGPLANCRHRWRAVAFDGRVDWIPDLVRGCGIAIWVNDRLATPLTEAEAIVATGARFVTFDDDGEGSALAALNIAALPFSWGQILRGRSVLRGLEYLVIDPEFRRFRRHRTDLQRIVVSIGGTDSWRLTQWIAQALERHPAEVTLLFGPGADPGPQTSTLAKTFEIAANVPSLAQFFERFDLAVTAGGITPFEANCSGLPCVIVSSEPWEYQNAEYLASQGGAVHAGYRDNFDPAVLLAPHEISAMSEKAITAVDGLGAVRVAEAIVSA